VPGPPSRIAESRWNTARAAFCATALAVCAQVAGGCGWIERPARFVASQFKSPPESAIAEMGPAPVEAALISSDAWVDAPFDPRFRVDPALPRLRNAALEPLLSAQGAARPNLVPALELPEPTPRANAAIGLARWGDGRGYAVLVTTVEDVELKLPLRRAAVEGLGCLTKPSPLPALRGLLDRFGRCDAGNVMNYVPELHADLLRALSRHIDAANDPRFQEGLRAPKPEARAEALSAWGRTGQVDLPTAVLDLRADPNGQVRAATVAMLLARRHPQALDFAKNAMQDFDTEVRTTAIAGLAAYGGPEAVATLEAVMLHEGEVLRAEAVLALEALGAHEQVFAAANDKAWRVRRSVARCLAGHPDRRGVALARKLLADDGAEVRKATVAAIEGWPLPVAGPVLLTALSEPTYETRKIAAAQLAARWPAAALFSADLPDGRRAEAVAAIEARWTAEFGLIDHTALAEATTAAPSQALALPPERLDHLQRMVDELARSAAAGGTVGPSTSTLDSFGPDVVDALERLVVERNIRLPDVVYQQVLPGKGEEFAAAAQLAEIDVHTRRRAAQRLAEAAKQGPLRPLVVVRVAERGAGEPDGLVLRGLFESIAGDRSDASAALAYGTLGHLSPEVRRQAVEHLGRTADPKHAPVIAAGLADPHVGVIRAAAKGLGSPGMLLDAAPLERLLNDRDTAMRLEAARTLYVNRIPSGAAALERMAHEADAETRRRATVAMAETGDRQFLATLIGLLDDPMLNVRKTAVEGLSGLVGNDVSVVPGEVLPSLAERSSRWRAWYARQASAAPAGAIR
jgi:HEAT repeat protein